MTYKAMTAKVKEDLGVTSRKARAYIEEFASIYTGVRDAITDVKASYTDEGLVQITYTINSKEKALVLPPRLKAMIKKQMLTNHKQSTRNELRRMEVNDAGTSGRH